MASSEELYYQKKRRGRPATGRDRVYTVRLPDNLVANIDMWAKINGYSDRSSAIRAMIGHALADNETGLYAAKWMKTSHDDGPTVAITD